MNEKLPLNSLHLKLLAVVTMLIDHMGFTLFPHAVWMRAVGRLAFPIFCFLIAEGSVPTPTTKSATPGGCCCSPCCRSCRLT